MASGRPRHLRLRHPECSVNPHLEILFEDSHCLALVKPPGQFTQGEWAPAGEVTLETAVRRHLDAANPASVYLGIVHRLDRATSGVLIWAKTPKAARRLSSQFQSRKVVKEYWAIVETQAPGRCPSRQPAANRPQPRRAVTRSGATGLPAPMNRAPPEWSQPGRAEPARQSRAGGLRTRSRFRPKSGGLRSGPRPVERTSFVPRQPAGECRS